MFRDSVEQRWSEPWSQWSGLNRRPTVYETVALPLSYIGLQRAVKLMPTRIPWQANSLPLRVILISPAVPAAIRPNKFGIEFWRSNARLYW